MLEEVGEEVVEDFDTIVVVVAVDSVVAGVAADSVVVVVVVADTIAAVAAADTVDVVVVIMELLQRTRLGSLNSLVQADYPVVAVNNAIATDVTGHLVVVVLALNLAIRSYLKEMPR